MATLGTQYEIYKENNPDSKLTFEEWLEFLAKKIKKIFKLQKTIFFNIYIKKLKKHGKYNKIRIKTNNFGRSCKI